MNKKVYVDEVLAILSKHGSFIFVTDNKRYSDMVNEVANLPSASNTEVLKALEDVKAEIEENKENPEICLEDTIRNDALDDVLKIIDRKVNEVSR